MGERCSGTPCGYQALRHTRSVLINLLICIINGCKGMSEENFKVRTPWFRPYSDVRMLLTLLQGVSKAAVRSMASAIDEQTGTPQNPVDWSDPDRWIGERLQGNNAQLAQHIWQDSHHTYEPVTS